MKFIFFALLLATQAHAAEPRFGLFCEDLLQKNPLIKDYAADFDAGFRTAIPAEALKSVFQNLYKDVGRCTSYDTQSKANGSYSLTLRTEKNLNALFTVNYDTKQSRFTGLQLDGLDDPSYKIESWDDVKHAVERVEPHAQFSATLQTADGVLSLGHDEKRPLAIGSAFKLYVLGALVEAVQNGSHSWQETMAIRDDLKSLPSGVMQTWPAGKTATLYDFAEKMISLSDNTATDHLLFLLGRPAVEKILSPMGNLNEDRYLPFLLTAEMFKLKWVIPPNETKLYLSGSREQRLRQLESLQTISFQNFGKNGIPFGKPYLIDQIEWFASPHENCQAMFFLAARNSSEVRKILSKNVPILKDIGSPTSHWNYAGYKGGSEPGVLNLTFLLESKSGRHACLAFTLNDNQQDVSMNSVLGVVKKTLEYAETVLP